MNILNNLKSLAVIAIATMAFTSCSKDQTSFSIDDIQGKARIKGTVFYSEGTNNRGDEIIKMATNTTILVKIDNSYLSPIGNAEGTTTFETVTNGKGEYEIEIPVLEKGALVTIQPQAFIGKQKNSSSNETEEGIFTAEATCQVVPNDIQFKDIEYQFNAR